MKNYVSDPVTITVTAPAAVDSGDLVIVGGLIGVAQTDAANASPVAIVREGVFTLPKNAGFAPAAGAAALWDTSEDDLRSAGDLAIGWYTKGAASGDTSAEVLLTCCSELPGIVARIEALEDV